MNKICSKCKELKELTAFSNDSRYLDKKYPSCKICKSQVARKYYTGNREAIIQKDVARHIDNLKDSAYRLKHNSKCKAWSKANPRKEYQATYARNRRASDINFKLAGNLRNRLNSALRNNQRVGSAVTDLGCSIEELKQHLESRWQLGMSWDNYGNGSGHWNIDHIDPLSKSDLSNPAEIKKACNYNNLQPLWYELNIIKSDMVTSR